MTDETSLLKQLREEVIAGRMNRRDVLKRGLALGLSAPAIAGLLAACGGGGDDDAADEEDTGAEPTERTAPGANAGATQTTEAGGDEPAEAATAEEEATESGEAEATEPAGDSAGAGQRGGGGTVNLLYWQAPTILNPHLGQGTKDNHASRVCLEPLADFDRNTEPVLVLANEWPTVENELLDPDGMYVIWKLREGVKWHDGEDFTADDVKFTYDWISNPDSTATTLGTYSTIESVEVVDDFTVQVNFTEPNPAWFDPFMGSAGVILPEHYFQDWMGVDARDAPGNLEPVGTGPWKIAEFRPGDVALFEIFEDYWEDGKPYFDNVEIKGGGDATSAARAVLETGEADWAWNLQVEPQILNQMEQAGGQGEVIAIPGNSAERIMINFADPNTEVDGARAEPSTEHPIWKHKEARQALNLAIQRGVIAEQLYGAAGVPTAHILNVPEKFKPEDFTWEYDLEQAQELLSQINFPQDFESTHILYSTSINSVRQKNQEIVKGDLEQLGFTVELKSVDSGVFFSSDAGNPDTYGHFYADIEMYTNGPSSPYPIAWAERFRSDDIAEQANNWSGTNITRYDNPEFDELHDQAKVEIDEERQIEIWHEMMRIPYEDIVEIPIVWRGSAAAVHNRLQNVEVTNWGDHQQIGFMKNWTL